MVDQSSMADGYSLANTKPSCTNIEALTHNSLKVSPDNDVMHELAEALQRHPGGVEPRDVCVLYLPVDSHCVIDVAELTQSQRSGVTYIQLLEHQQHISNTFSQTIQQLHIILS